MSAAKIAEAEEHVILGEWWLPGRRAHTPGTLRLFGPNAPVLELVGTLEPRRDDASRRSVYRVVHGRALGGECLTLVGSLRVQRVLSHPVSDRLYPETVLRGGLFTGNELAFDAVSVEMSHLREWLGSFVKAEDMRGPVEQPDPASIASLPGGGTVQARRWLGVAVDSRGDTTRELADLLIQLPRRMNLARILERYVRPLQDLVTLASDVPNRLGRLTVARGTGPAARSADVVIRSVFQEPSAPAEAHFWGDMLFQADGMEGLPFTQLVPRWMDLHRRAGQSIDVLVSLLYEPPTFYDVRFLLAVTAAEGYDRAVSGDKDTAERRRRRTRAIRSAAVEHQNWLDQVLPRGPSFSMRLDRLTEHAGSTLIPLVKAVPTFRKRTLRLRNVYAHQFRVRPRDRASGHELFGLTLLVGYVVRLAILHDLGLTDSEVQWHFSNHPAYNADLRRLLESPTT